MFLKRFIVLSPHHDAVHGLSARLFPWVFPLCETDAAWDYRRLRAAARHLRERHPSFALDTGGGRRVFRQAAVANMVVCLCGNVLEWKIGRLVWLKHQARAPDIHGV